MTAELLHHVRRRCPCGPPALRHAPYVPGYHRSHKLKSDLPVITDLIALFKPKPKPKANLSHSLSGPASVSAVAIATPSTKKPKPTLAHLAREMNFDMLLLKLSFFVECLSHTLVALSPASLGEGFFVAFTTLSSLGSGVIPAASSLALCIMQMQKQASTSAGGSDEDGGAGQLFGALAALQAVGQMILGVSFSSQYTRRAMLMRVPF